MVGASALVVARLAESAITSRVFPGCAIGVIQGAHTDVHVFGHETYESGTRAVTETALYDCASLTKSVVTASIALKLIDTKKLSLEDQLVTFVPEYATRFREEVLIRHLLTYTLGNSLPLSCAGSTPEEIFQNVCREDTKPPGTVFNYSNTPAFLLGIVIERIFGRTLDSVARSEIFEPTGMSSATFSPRGAVPSEENVCDVPHDESARIFAREGRVVGHAGLFATIHDLLAFVSHLCAHPDERICTNKIAHLGESASLGWELNQPWMGTNCAARTFGKTGFTGCSIVTNFDAQTAVVILSNRTFPDRPSGREAIDGFRIAVCDIVFA